MGVLSGETEEVQAEVVEAPKRKPLPFGKLMVKNTD